MRTILERLRREWQALSAKARRALSAVIVLAIALALPAMLYWFAGEHERLARRVAEADARFEACRRQCLKSNACIGRRRHRRNRPPKKQ